MGIATVKTRPRIPRISPARARPFPVLDPFDREIWLRATAPKIVARRLPIPHSQTSPSTKLAIARALVRGGY